MIFLQFDDVIVCMNNLKNKTDDAETLRDCEAALNEMLTYEFVIAIRM